MSPQQPWPCGAPLLGQGYCGDKEPRPLPLKHPPPHPGQAAAYCGARVVAGTKSPDPFPHRHPSLPGQEDCLTGEGGLWGKRPRVSLLTAALAPWCASSWIGGLQGKGSGVSALPAAADSFQLVGVMGLGRGTTLTASLEAGRNTPSV